MVPKLWRWRGDGCCQYLSLLRTLITSTDIQTLQSLCELHKPCLLSPLPTLYRAGCHALRPQLIPEYLLVKDPHGPSLGSLCQWVGVGVLYPFYPISLLTSLENSLTQCICQRPYVFLLRQRKSEPKLHGR